MTLTAAADNTWLTIFAGWFVIVGIFIGTMVYGTEFLKRETGFYDDYLANLWPPARLLVVAPLAAAFRVVFFLLLLLVMFLLFKLGDAITNAPAEP